MIVNGSKIYRCRHPCCNITEKDHKDVNVFGNDEDWLILEKYIEDNGKYDNEKDLQLVLGLSKYHYYTGPDDWDEEYKDKALEFVRDWNEWLNEDDVGEDNQEWMECIEDVILKYNEGSIPDAFLLFHDYTD